MQNAKDSWTKIGVVMTILCFCLGVLSFYSFGPFCWQCMSAREVVPSIGWKFHGPHLPLTDPRFGGWICNHCRRGWNSLAPYKGDVVCNLGGL